MEGFNTYITQIECDIMKLICMEKGELVTFSKNECFSMEGARSHKIGYVNKGIFRYLCHNKSEGKDYSTGYAFADEFVADYPACLHDSVLSEITIQAVVKCEVYVCDAKELMEYYDQSSETQKIGRLAAEYLLIQVYSAFLDMYRKTPEERYEEILERCPQILEVLTLKELASYLKVTPETVSHIRKKILYKR